MPSLREGSKSSLRDPSAGERLWSARRRTGHPALDRGSARWPGARGVRRSPGHRLHLGRRRRAGDPAGGGARDGVATDQRRERHGDEDRRSCSSDLAAGRVAGPDADRASAVDRGHALHRSDRSDEGAAGSSTGGRPVVAPPGDGPQHGDGRGVTPAPRILIVVSADATRDAQTGPRRDYAVLASVLRATLLDRRALARSPLSRALARIAGQAAAQAWMAFRRRSRYDVIITDGEHVGIPLALLLRLSRDRVEHITIGHRLSAPKKRMFFTLLRADERMDRIIVHSRQQFDYAAAVLGIALTRLVLMPYQGDAGFWKPSRGAEEPLIVSAGLEYRDYATLFRAVAGLPVRVIIGASSPWSRHRTETTAPPPNVELGTFDYIALRDLYQR